MTFSIRKPSFWKSDREIRDPSNALVGEYRVANAWWTKGEGEAYGRKLRFGYTGWDGRYSQMTDESGNILAHMEPAGWWGLECKLTYGAKVYRWKLNGWGTAFTVYEGETELMRVTPRGYFKEGTIALGDRIDAKDAIPLALYGIYQLQMISSQSAASGGGAS